MAPPPPPSPDRQGHLEQLLPGDLHRSLMPLSRPQSVDFLVYGSFTGASGRRVVLHEDAFRVPSSSRCSVFNNQLFKSFFTRWRRPRVWCPVHTGAHQSELFSNR